MKDYVNPLLLLAVIVLMACRGVAETADDAAVSGTWAAALCVTAVLVDGALALASALARRRPLMYVVWSVSFLVLGCCIWAMPPVDDSQEAEAYREQQRAATDPLARDAEGETLLSRAAALGRLPDVVKLLNETHPPMELIAEAGMRAAENNRVEVLEALARAGMPANAVVRGVPLLHGAALNGACKAMEWLLMRGAEVNARDAEGATALIQAAASAGVPAVRVLLKYGADVRLRDTDGRCAADFAKTEEMDALLTPHTTDHP